MTSQQVNWDIDLQLTIRISGGIKNTDNAKGLIANGNHRKIRLTDLAQHIDHIRAHCGDKEILSLFIREKKAPLRKGEVGDLRLISRGCNHGNPLLCRVPPLHGEIIESK